MIIIKRFHVYQKPPLQGFLSVYLPKMDLYLNDLTLWEKDGRRWLNYPGKKDAEKHCYYCFGKEMNAKFQEQVLAALDLYLQEQSNER